MRSLWKLKIVTLDAYKTVGDSIDAKQYSEKVFSSRTMGYIYVSSLFAVCVCVHFSAEEYHDIHA